jgi:hypothetical protein
MRPLSVFLAIGLLLPAGCATSSGDSGSGGSGPAPGGEFQIRDYMETDVPREVYLAKFEIVPERGVSLIYPTTDDEPRQVGPGIHRLPRAPTAFVNDQRDRYESPFTGLLNRDPSRVTSVTVLVVISDRPLNLDPFLRAPSGVRDELGTRAYTDEILAVEGILGTVIAAPGIAATEHQIRRVSLPGAWSLRR